MINEIKVKLQNLFKSTLEAISRTESEAEVSAAIQSLNTSVAEQMQLLEDQIAELKTQADNGDKVADLEAKIQALEASVSTLESDKEALSSESEELKQQVSDLEEKQTQLTGENEQLKEANAKLSKDSDTPPADIQSTVEEEDLQESEDWEKEQDRKLAARTLALQED